MSTSIVKLTNIDDPSHKNGGIIFQSNIELKADDKNFYWGWGREKL